MKRRNLVLFGAFAPIRAARAQTGGRGARVGVLSGWSAGAAMATFFEPLLRRLAELGHAVGRNLEIEHRFADGKLDRLPALAAELLARNPDVLVAVGPAAPFAAAATKTVPLVAIAVNDPVRMGLAQTMARPGGNVTGVSSWGIELIAKRLQLLKELAPAARRFGIFSNHNAGRFEAADLEGFERSLGLAVVSVTAGNPDEFDAAFATLARERVGGLVVTADPMIHLHRARIGQFCTQQRLPSVWGAGAYLDAGGLASYQADFDEVIQ
ncbi:MAG: ABC transporter substrate-binding protein [Pseudomonadota bacterium]